MKRNAHYFYAIKIPSDIKELLRERALMWKKSLSFKRWVHHEDYHFTLAFLGSAKEESLHESIEFVKKALRVHRPFSLTLNHLGVFGRKDAPRVFWAGCEEEPKLFALREAVFSACLDAGFTLETRPFHPHLTLARTWAAKEMFSEAILHKHDSLQVKPVSFSVQEVVLYKTNMEKTPKYEVAESFSL